MNNRSLSKNRAATMCRIAYQKPVVVDMAHFAMGIQPVCCLNHRVYPSDLRKKQLNYVQRVKNGRALVGYPDKDIDENDQIYKLTMCEETFKPISVKDPDYGIYSFRATNDDIPWPARPIIVDEADMYTDPTDLQYFLYDIVHSAYGGQIGWNNEALG